MKFFLTEHLHMGPRALSIFVAITSLPLFGTPATAKTPTGLLGLLGLF